MKKRILGAALLATCFLGTMASHEVKAEDTGGYQEMYRLYQKVNGEHFYTANAYERDVLVRDHGWKYEGVGWVAPAKSNTPVYRLYNPNLGDHHYTTSKNEKDTLVAKHGWKYEGIGWYSSDSKAIGLHRLYNPGLKTGNHHYTTNAYEKDVLVAQHGWKYEGMAWYGVQRLSSISQKSTPTSMTVGQKHNIQITANPSNSSDKGFKVSSSDNNVVSVSGTTITAKKAGKVTITATSNDGSKVSRVTVTVKANTPSTPSTPTTVAVTKIEHSGTPTTLEVGKQHEVKATVAPTNASDKSFKVTSSDSNVVSVSGKTIKALKPGKSTISVISTNGKVHQLSVTVKDPIIHVASVALSGVPSKMTTASYDVNTSKATYETSQLNAAVTPNNATNKNVTYKSSDPSIVKIEGSTIKALKGGKATITVETADGKKTDSKVVAVTERYPNAGGDITLTPKQRGMASWQVGKTYGYYNWYGDKLSYDDIRAFDYYGNEGEITKKIYAGDLDSDTSLENPHACYTGLVAEDTYQYSELNLDALGIEADYLGFDSGKVTRGMVGFDDEQTYVNNQFMLGRQISPLRVVWVFKPERGTVTNIAFRTYAEAEAYARANIGNNLGYKIQGTGDFRGDMQKFLVVYYANYDKVAQKAIDNGGTYEDTNTYNKYDYVSRNEAETHAKVDAYLNDQRLYNLDYETGQMAHPIRQVDYTVWKDSDGNFSIFAGHGTDITYRTYQNNIDVDHQLEAIGWKRILDKNNWLGWDEKAHMFDRDKGLPTSFELDAQGIDYIS